jgi:hypothetical protein
MHLISPPLMRSSCAMRASIRAVGQFLRNLVEGETHTLGKNQEGDAAKHRSRVAAMSGASPLRPNQPPLLIEAQRRRRYTATASNLGNREQVCHGKRKYHTRRLDFKLT